MTPRDAETAGDDDQRKPIALSKFLSRLIWLCMLPLLILTIYLATDHVKTLKNQCDVTARDLAHNVANAIDLQLRSQITSLKALADSPSLDDPINLEDFYREAQAVLKNYATHVILADLSSQMILNTRSPLGSELPSLPVPKGFAAAPHVLDTGDTAVGDMFVGPIAKEPLIAVVVPVTRNNQLRFLLLNAVETRQFQKILAQIAVPAKWSINLYDSKGDIIASRHPLGSDDILQDEGSKDFEVNSSLSRWRVKLTVPPCAYTTPIVWSSTAMMLAVLVAIMTGFWGARRAAKGLSRSVEALSTAPLPKASEPLIEEVERARARLTKAILDRESAELLRFQVENRYSRLFAAAPVPISFVTMKGVITDINERFIKVFGYTLEEVPTLEKWRALAYPDEKYRAYVALTWQQAMKKALSENTDVPPTEFHVTCKNGEVRIMLISAVMVGEGFLTTFFDITERKKYEEALHDSEERFRLLADGAFEGVVISRDAKFLDFNEIFSHMTGYSQEELVGTGFISIIPAEYRELVLSHIKRNSEEAYEAEIIRKDGKIVPVQMRSKIIPYEGSIAQLASVRDIEAVKKGEAVQKRLATAITQAAEAVLITDADGIIQYVNPALERISGFSSAEVTGQTPRIFKSGEHDESFYKDLWGTIKSGKTWSGRFTNRRKDGTLYYEESTISPVRDASGKIVNFVAVKRDVTEYLSLSRQLFQAQKLEAIGTLAGGIAHDFNNILQVCLGYSQLLTGDKSLPPHLMDDANNIYEASRRGADLVHRLLTFSKKKETKLQALDLNLRINEMKKMLERTIPKNIGIKLVLTENLELINADPTQVDQVIMNIVVNSRDAMPLGGKLIIETANIHLNEDYAKTHLYVNPGQYVLLTLTDSGTGMDDVTLSRIFEPFFTTKGQGQGTGLGLSVVFGIVEQHGGFVRFYSKPGHGTTCKIYFPALRAEQQNSQASVQEASRGGSETILVVDDEEQILDFLVKALGRSGYCVLVARNGKQAIEQFVKHREEIDLLILDLMMPEMGGVECLEKLLKIDPSVKVIMSSGFSANGKIAESVKAGSKGFVTKPFDISLILRTIRNVLEDRV